MNTMTTKLSDSLTISKVLIGLWQVADLERNNKKLDPLVAAKALHSYYEQGFTSFDMADHYGSSEEISGVFKNTYGLNDIQLLTKWVPSPGSISPAQIQEAVKSALKKLQVEQIQLLQFHAWNYADPSWLDCLFGLQKLKKEGLIANIGLTNFDEAHVNMVIQTGIPIISNQVCYSLLDQRAANKMTETCLAHNIKILAFGTVAGGFFSEKWLHQPEPLLNDDLTWSQMKYKRYIDAAGGWDWYQTLLVFLDTLAKKHSVSIATIASAYIKDLPAVGGVIVGARLGESSHIEENKKILGLILLETEREDIKKILAQGNRIPGDCGDEYRKPPFLTASGDLSHHISEIASPYPTIKDATGKTKALSGTSWESLAGYSRAVRKGDRILVSGTTATHGSNVIGGNDPAAQAHFIFDKIEGAIQSLGGKLEDIVRTRVFVKDINQWEAIARAHGQRFADIQPVNTMVQANLIGDEYLVEIEAEAIVE
jgi:aryl-alcohol dehydrogenase-like predicted oxidoreductase/enamine deaminase RidA (YjgF/YER057c/UK114 family)